MIDTTDLKNACEKALVSLNTITYEMEGQLSKVKERRDELWREMIKVRMI